MLTGIVSLLIIEKPYKWCESACSGTVFYRDNYSLTHSQLFNRSYLLEFILDIN